MISSRSTDRGKTWSAARRRRATDGPEASYAVLLKVPSGRVYVFYNHNTDNVRQVIGRQSALQGRHRARASTASGTSSSSTATTADKPGPQERYEIPQRDFEIDRKNPTAAS